MLNVLIIILAVVIFCLYSPYFQKLDPIQYSVSLPMKFEGPMTVNERLDSVEKLHEDEIYWPESMAMHEGDIYTGLGDGRIVRISNKGIKDICRIGNECQGQHEEHVCGRPLAMQFDKKGLLYVVDAYHGLFSVNVKTGEKKQILASSKYVDGKPLTFLNGLTLDEDEQVIYLSQSSTKWNISMVIVSIIEHDTSGRLLKYDIKRNILTVLAQDIAFANGIELSHDKKSILLAEGNTHKILRYDIRSSQEVVLEELPLILPGEPDNISRNKRGNYWVGVSNARTAESPTLYDRFSSYPVLRKGFLQTHYIIASPIASILRLFPSKWAKETAFELLNGRILADVSSFHGIIVEFDDKGTIIQSLHSPTGKVARISEVLEYDEYLYLGSWRNNFLGRVRL